MALTKEDAQSIIDAEERNKVRRFLSTALPTDAEHADIQVIIFVGYMRRYATAYERLKEEVGKLSRINHVVVRDILGPVRSPFPSYIPRRH
jgi:RNA binding exosome subunit